MPMKTEADRPQFIARRTIFLSLLGWVILSAVLVGVEQARKMVVYERVLRYQEGDTVKEDFVVNHDFSFIDEEDTEKLIMLNRSLANPVYIISDKITKSVLDRFESFTAMYTNAVFGESSDDEQAQFRTDFPGIADLIHVTTPRDPKLMGEILKFARKALQDLQYKGIFKIDPTDSGAASGIVEAVYSEMNPNQRITLFRESLMRPESLTDDLRTLESLKDLSLEYHGFVIALMAYFAEANAFFSKLLTEENMDRAEAKTKPVMVSIRAGTYLLRPGDIVTSRQAKIIRALNEKRRLDYKSFVNPFIIMAAMITLGIFISRILSIAFPNQKSLYFYGGLLCLYLLILASMNAFIHYSDSFRVSLIIPTTLFIILLNQLLNDKHLALLTSLLMAMLVFFLTSGSPYDFLITLGSGMGGIVVSNHRDSAMRLFRTGPQLMVIMGFITFCSGILFGIPIENVLIMTAIAATNGLISGMLGLVLLPLLGDLFNMTTVFRLIELADQNNPILRKMRLQAPGTYVHSQSVAQLAEAACDAINGDALLARIGAYYHDIGKIDQAQFFVENQSEENKHDKMKTSLSVAVIRSHVKFGVEKGREMQLPDEVLAIIEQHHGTSLIRYFYNQAVREKGTESTSLNDYSYGGPKPRSKEAAVVMLADSTEAAIRSIKHLTKTKIEKCIWDIVMARFKARELDESDLTLRDLASISEAFTQVFAGQLHMRIKYPNDKEG